VASCPVIRAVDKGNAIPPRHTVVDYALAAIEILVVGSRTPGAASAPYKYRADLSTVRA